MLRLGLTAMVLGIAAASSLAAPAATSIGWADLLSADRSTEPRTESFGGDVEISGYALPTDIEDDRVYEFLLVPEIGGCSHTRQPPPNQLIKVRPDEPISLSRPYELVSITGALEPATVKTQFYFRDGILVVRSGYRMASAHVADTDRHPTPPAIQGSRNPWSFMRD